MADQEKAPQTVAAESQTRVVNTSLDRVLAELGRNVVQLRVTEEEYQKLQRQSAQQIGALSAAIKNGNAALVEANERNDKLEIELRDLLERCISPVDGPGPTTEEMTKRYKELRKRHPLPGIDESLDQATPGLQVVAGSTIDAPNSADVLRKEPIDH